MSRIALPGQAPGLDPAQIAAAAHQQQAAMAADVKAFYLAALSGCIAADFQASLLADELRRQREGISQDTPTEVRFNPERAAQAALQYAKAGFQQWKK